MENKRGQQMMSMPFGLIFSIILIVVFLVVAFLVITHFLNLQKCTKVGGFISDFEDEINSAWNSPSKTTEFSIYGKLPGGIKKVCFIDFEEASSGNEASKIFNDLRLYKPYKPNFVFYPAGDSCDIPYYTFKHINVTKIIENGNPFCFENKEDVKIKIEKGFYDSLVVVK